MANNIEFDEQLRKRTFDFSVRVFKFIESLERTNSTRIISYQLGKSASSIGANFRAFIRGRSYKEKYAKMCIVVEEADEVEYWLQNLNALQHGNKIELKAILEEIEQLVKITSKIKFSIGQIVTNKNGGRFSG